MNSSSLRELYPDIEPYNSGLLRVSSEHELYFEESGRPDGKPVVFLHGGPGGGTNAKMRRFFDPRQYRIILFDQRGCGQSRPHASLVDNTTQHLVADIETLRRHLGVDRWLVFGGSWGSTLALAYAQTHPEPITALILRGIFLVRRWELEWFYERADGAGAIFPDLWEQYVAPIPEAERGDMIRAYYQRLTSPDPQTRSIAAKAWTIWEGATSNLRINPEVLEKCEEEAFAAAIARIECHYFVNGGFIREGQLLAEVDKCRHIPTVIVQGRYDVVCPMKSAWDLHRAWPEAELLITADAGHSAFEPGNLSALVEAADRYAKTGDPRST